MLQTETWGPSMNTPPFTTSYQLRCPVDSVSQDSPGPIHISVHTAITLLQDTISQLETEFKLAFLYPVLLPRPH